MIRFGRAIFEIRSATWARISSAISSEPSTIALEGDECADRLARVLVGLADHRALGHLRMETTADSTSAVESRCPATLTTSSARPRIQK